MKGYIYAVVSFDFEKGIIWSKENKYTCIWTIFVSVMLFLILHSYISATFMLVAGWFEAAGMGMGGEWRRPLLPHHRHHNVYLPGLQETLARSHSHMHGKDRQADLDRHRGMLLACSQTLFTTTISIVVFSLFSFDFYNMYLIVWLKTMT